MTQSGWRLLLEGLIHLDDRRRLAETDIQRVNAKLNLLEKAKKMPMTRKRRKAGILKEIRKRINPALESFYTVHNAIHVQRLAEYE